MKGQTKRKRNCRALLRAGDGDTFGGDRRGIPVGGIAQFGLLGSALVGIRRELLFVGHERRRRMVGGSSGGGAGAGGVEDDGGILLGDDGRLVGGGGEDFLVGCLLRRLDRNRILDGSGHRRMGNAVGVLLGGGRQHRPRGLNGARDLNGAQVGGCGGEQNPGAVQAVLETNRNTVEEDQPVADGQLAVHGRIGFQTLDPHVALSAVFGIANGEFQGARGEQKRGEEGAGRLRLRRRCHVARLWRRHFAWHWKRRSLLFGVAFRLGRSFARGLIDDADKVGRGLVRHFCGFLFFFRGGGAHDGEVGVVFLDKSAEGTPAVLRQVAGWLEEGHRMLRSRLQLRGDAAFVERFDERLECCFRKHLATKRRLGNRRPVGAIDLDLGVSAFLVREQEVIRGSRRRRHGDSVRA